MVQDGISVHFTLLYFATHERNQKSRLPTRVGGTGSDGTPDVSYGEEGFHGLVETEGRVSDRYGNGTCGTQ